VLFDCGETEIEAVNALIIYDTLYGNTKQIAEAIAIGLTERVQVQTVAASEVDKIEENVDLLLVGGPTHQHGLSYGMRELFERWPSRSLHQLPAAAFDTRYRGPAWLMGSAADKIGRMLKSKGVNLVIAPESFFVARDHPDGGDIRHHENERLEPGEVERARAWGEQVASLVPSVTCAQ
jgi:flavodoxin